MLKADVAKLVGAGVNVIEMNFLPDVYVQCSEKGCALPKQVKFYKGKSIADVLDMTVEEAMEF